MCGAKALDCERELAGRGVLVAHFKAMTASMVGDALGTLIEVGCLLPQGEGTGAVR